MLFNIARKSNRVYLLVVQVQAKLYRDALNAFHEVGMTYLQG